jgi:hypothetical protein
MIAMQNSRWVETRDGVRWLSLVTVAAVVTTLVACSKSSSTSSASGAGHAAGPAMTGAQAGSQTPARIISNASKLVMDGINKPTAPMHLSYSGQENINPNFPTTAGSKPQVGPLLIQADVAPAKVSVTTTTGTTKQTLAGDSTNVMNMANARMQLVMALLPANITLAFGSAAAQPAGSESVGAVSADRYDVNTATASPSAQAGFQAAAAMFGRQEKVQSVKGSVWVDKATGRLVKMSLDTQLTDTLGDKWTEHREMLVTE